MKKWFEGIYLLGIYSRYKVGCWLLAHGGDGAVLEMPPRHEKGESPEGDAVRAAEVLGIDIKYLLCTHAHLDHCDGATLQAFQSRFPNATPLFQEGFRERHSHRRGCRYFREEQEISLAGEPLYLIHAPKHSMTDTIVIFRGVACTGDWELNTIRSVHDDKPTAAVPRDEKLRAIGRMQRFPHEHNYHIHATFAPHANDRREGVDFVRLMAETREDRKLW